VEAYNEDHAAEEVMSDLKYKTVEQLETERHACDRYIFDLSSKLAGQKQRMDWIKKYIFEKTPQELTINQIEQKLGHKIIIKE
jgi:hypothetical protein